MKNKRKRNKDDFNESLDFMIFLLGVCNNIEDTFKAVSEVKNKFKRKAC